MAYNAQQHATVANRIRDYFRAIQNQREEGARLKEILVNLAQNGAHANFVDTDDYTEAELLAATSMYDDLELLFTNGQPSQGHRTGWILPFLTGEV